ncbi:MAG TPA: AarF/UbiB family protein [Acidimicrobiia bacterium]|nr:AarF/UbiB family protein [Acidimicrobiia bacterium]
MTQPADLKIGAFSETAPWIVEPAEMRWLRGLDPVRKRVADEVPHLLARRVLPPGGRFAKVATLVGGATAGWAIRERRKGSDESRAGLARRYRRAFEGLGTTYIKLGQILSSGEGIFPQEVVREFRLCRDQVPAESLSSVKQVIEEDLGGPVETFFARFDPSPLAAASIAQVHAAQLLTGEEVVVKIQRPHVASLVRKDIVAMAWLAERLVGRIQVAALANPPAIVELFAETILEELDFRLEAESMLDVARILAETDQREIVVPRPHPTLVTRRVLVMERLAGFSFEDVTGMRQAGIDTQAVLRAGLIATMEGSLLFGIFHGDLHGGNMFVQPDGKVALLDYGITGRLNEPQRVALLKLLVAALANDIRPQIEALVDFGALPPDTDVDEVIRELHLDRPIVDPTTMTADELVGEIRDIVKGLLSLGARMPKELMLFLKNLIFLDAAIATLAPDLDILGELTRVYAYFVERHGERIAADLGLEHAGYVGLDLTGVKASFGLTEDVDQLTYRELQERRAVIQKRLRGTSPWQAFRRR